MDPRLTSAFWTLRIAFGLTALLAGLDKFMVAITIRPEKSAMADAVRALRGIPSISSMLGTLRNNAETRSEFLRLCGTT